MADCTASGAWHENPEEVKGLSLEFQPQVPIKNAAPPSQGALYTSSRLRQAYGAAGCRRPSAFAHVFMERASLPPPPGLRRDQCEADLEYRAKATADKLSSKLTTRSEGVLEYCASVRTARRDRKVGDAEGAVECSSGR